MFRRQYVAEGPLHCNSVNCEASHQSDGLRKFSPLPPTAFLILALVQFMECRFKIALRRALCVA
jgi:hypothetical protein